MYKSVLKFALTGALLAGILATGAVAQDIIEVKNVGVTGYAAYDFRQVVKGNWNESAIDHYWAHEVFAGIGFRAQVSDRLDIIARVEGKMWNPYPQEKQRSWRSRNYSLWVDQACAKYAAIGTTDAPVLSITGGYFVHKYNPEARNLGEFLFRSYTYPGIIMNDFDFPAARLLGFKFHADLLEGMVKNDFIIQDESEQWPYGDISLSDIATLNLGNVLEIGGGFNLARIFSVNEKYTTPPDSQTNRIISRIDTTGGIDSIVFADGFYTFKASKIMGRATFDPKPLFGSPVLFGGNDLKMYGEIAVIGLKDYPFYYTTMSERMPIMFGMNLPAFKVLDIISIEFEHYAFPFNPSNENVIFKGAPLPKDEATLWVPENWKDDNWKWSVYLKKTLVPGIYFTLQFSRDHLRLPYPDGMPFYRETLVKPGDWSWVAKFAGSI